MCVGDGMCAFNGVCVNITDLTSGDDDTNRPENTCPRDTGGSCVFSSCEDWRNAECVSGSCVCTKDHCSTHGSCLDVSIRPNSNVQHPREDNGVALILSGGAAKGAFELGMLRGLCGNKGMSSNFTSWTKIFGVSIGALNAAGMAQFPRSEQCTRALDFLETFWTSIKTPENVFTSPRSTADARAPCMAAASSGEDVISWEEQGGLCNPSPGGAAVEYVIHASDIRSSGMQLRVAATSVNSGTMVWWNESSLDIVQGAMASGRLAPVMPPLIIRGEMFIDGGFISNTPIRRALNEGATTVLALYLSPSSGLGVSPYELNSGNVGPQLAQFTFNLIMNRYSLITEIKQCCQDFPHATIFGYIPTESPGDLLDFTEAGIKTMMAHGYDFTANSLPEDLCIKIFELEKEAKKHRDDAQSWTPPAPPAIGLARKGTRSSAVGFKQLRLLARQMFPYVVSVLGGAVGGAVLMYVAGFKRTGPDRVDAPWGTLAEELLGSKD